VYLTLNFPTSPNTVHVFTLRGYLFLLLQIFQAVLLITAQAPLLLAHKRLGLTPLYTTSLLSFFMFYLSIHTFLKTVYSVTPQHVSQNVSHPRHAYMTCESCSIISNTLLSN